MIKKLLLSGAIIILGALLIFWGFDRKKVIDSMESVQAVIKDISVERTGKTSHMKVTVGYENEGKKKEASLDTYSSEMMVGDIIYVKIIPGDEKTVALDSKRAYLTMMFSGGALFIIGALLCKESIIDKRKRESESEYGHECGY